jgi:uncharacterized protein DUF1445
LLEARNIARPVVRQAAGSRIFWARLLFARGTAWDPRHVAPGGDVRTEVPRYRLYRRGVLGEEPTDIIHLWRKDLVAFLLGCSFSFEAAMQRAGLPVRHLEQHCNVPMFRTNLPCTPTGTFRGPLVVTMRPSRLRRQLSCSHHVAIPAGSRGSDSFWRSRGNRDFRSDAP